MVIMWTNWEKVWYLLTYTQWPVTVREFFGKNNYHVINHFSKKPISRYFSLKCGKYNYLFFFRQRLCERSELTGTWINNEVLWHQQYCLLSLHSFCLARVVRNLILKVNPVAQHFNQDVKAQVWSLAPQRFNDRSCIFAFNITLFYV